MGSTSGWRSRRVETRASRRPTAPEGRHAAGRLGVPGALALGFAVSWNIADTGAVAGQLADAYGVGLAIVGLFTTALFVTHFLMQVPAGRLIDRYGARRIGLAAIGVVASANAIALIAPRLWIVLVARLLMGVGTAAGFIAGSDYIRSLGGSPTLQGLYGGITLAGPGLALAVVPPLVGPLGWRAPFLSALVLCLGLVTVLALAPEGERSAAAGRRTRVLELFRDRRLYRFAAIHAAGFGLSVVIGNWVVTLLEHDGWSSTTSGVVGSLVLFGGLLTRPLGGWLLRRDADRARTWVAGSLLIGAGATIVLALDAPLPVLVLAAAAVGLAAGIPFAPAFAGAQRLRPDAPGTAIGVVNAFAALTIVAGTPLLGLAFDPFGHGRAGFVVVAVIWAAAVLAAPRRLPRPARVRATPSNGGSP
jgi:MFS family permease